MRSARIVLALTRAGGRRSALRSRPLLLQPHAGRCLSSAGAKTPSNPFEIDLNALTATTSAIDKGLTLDDATQAATLQQAEAQHDIDLLHGEMSKLFGEEVAEYGGDTSSSSVEETVAAFDKRTRTRGQKDVVKERRDPVLQPPVTITARKSKMAKESPAVESNAEQSISSENALVDVLLLQGPCSFVRGVWTGGDMKKNELHRQIQTLADGLKIVVKDRNYDSEKIILQTLLEAREDHVIVLCWNISLKKSPFVVHALELIRSRIIVVSPSNVEHGPLPANVVGVLSGFRNQSISLALSVAANLLESGPDSGSQTGVQKTKQHELSNGNDVTLLNSAGIASSKKGVPSSKAKKKALICYLCGKEGHIRSKCPDLPRNNM